MEETNEFLKLLEDVNLNFKENINDIPRELKDGIMKLSYSEAKKIQNLNNIDSKQLTSILYRAYIMGMMFEKETKKYNKYRRKTSNNKVIKIYAN